MGCLICGHVERLLDGRVRHFLQGQGCSRYYTRSTTIGPAHVQSITGSEVHWRTRHRVRRANSNHRVGRAAFGQAELTKARCAWQARGGCGWRDQPTCMPSPTVQMASNRIFRRHSSSLTFSFENNEPFFATNAEYSSSVPEENSPHSSNLRDKPLELHAACTMTCGIQHAHRRRLASTQRRGGHGSKTLRRRVGRSLQNRAAWDTVPRGIPCRVGCAQGRLGLNERTAPQCPASS